MKFHTVSLYTNISLSQMIVFSCSSGNDLNRILGLLFLKYIFCINLTKSSIFLYKYDFVDWVLCI